MVTGERVVVRKLFVDEIELEAEHENDDGAPECPQDVLQAHT